MISRGILSNECCYCWYIFFILKELICQLHIIKNLRIFFCKINSLLMNYKRQYFRALNLEFRKKFLKYTIARIFRF